MNYPVWDIPGSGLLIAGIAILHVFISHFAVGGGLFLVLAERKARLEDDRDFLAYVKRHSRFFVLLTLVLGAITGVGIWFTIGLVHPQATSSLISTFVWGWAIEWTFFVAEIAAAMVYYYGWDRLSSRSHLAVGWIYFANAWLSLVVINGILTYMLTPGAWVATRGFWDGFFNDTYWPGLVARTFASAGLAGLYALLTASWLAGGDLKEKVARYAAWGWIVPMAIALPLALLWYLAAAAGAGVPVAEILGAKTGGIGPILSAIFSRSDTGYPIAQAAGFWLILASVTLVVLTLYIALMRAREYRWPLAACVMVLGFVAMGSGEWVREDLRKPYVIGQFMFVHGVRLPAAPGVPQPPPETSDRFGRDRFTVEALNTNGVLATSAWIRPTTPEMASDYLLRVGHEGRELFRVECSWCHTDSGYLAIRPLVRGKSVSALQTVLTRMAEPVDAQGNPVGWDTAGLRLKTWRSRRMPPFVGTGDERRTLSAYLALLGGANATDLAPPEPGAAERVGKSYYETNCSACHAAEGLVPFDARGRTAEQIYELIGRLPGISEMMPAFEGAEEERRALAAYMATIRGAVPKGGA
ncbi:MAG: cytochrome ubiquinol oxidase subunit I [Acidobacteriota bacterium]